MKTKLFRTVNVGNFVLKEYDLIDSSGESIDTICKVHYKKQRSAAIYCSIPDAMAHRCEWDDGSCG